MNEKIIHNVLLGVSALVGVFVASKVYDTGMKSINKDQLLIEDAEIISEEEIIDDEDAKG